MFSCGSSCSQIGKHINLGLMRFTVRVQSISMPQCVEDVLLICRGADCTECEAGPACHRYTEPTAYLLCIETEHLFKSSGHKASWVELLLLVLL